MSLPKQSEDVDRTENRHSTYLSEGSAYLRAAAGKTKKFDESIQYNLLAMALEKFLMAALEHHHAMPDNHTFTDLVEGAQKYCPLPKDLAQTLLSFEKHQMICSFADYFRTETLNEQVIEDMREAVKQLESWTIEICEEGVSL